MSSPILGEFIGTLVLILLGDGVVACVLLKRSKAEGSGWMVITAGWAFAVVGGVFAAIACGSKDAFINPAVTLGFAISSGDYSKLLPYATAQLLHRRESHQRNHRYLRPGLCFRRNFLKNRRERRARCWPWALPRRLCGLGHRSVAWRNHWLCHQSGA